MPAPRTRPAILLTGFGPFPGVRVNASSILVSALAPIAARAFPGFCVEHHELATEWAAGTARLVDLVQTVRPLVALHFGVSHKAAGFVIETRSYNQRSAVVDNCGVKPEPACLAAGAPETLFATLPAGLIASRLRSRGLPVEISRDAGRYLCNAALFHSLELARQDRWPMRASGFIHLPHQLHARDHLRGSQLTLPQAIEGGLEIIGACLGAISSKQVRRSAPISFAHQIAWR
jgi:pyroglutamyl-peptidase